MTLSIVSLLPRLQNTNGDAENARVLATRARWAGLEAEVIEVETAAQLPPRVDAIVLGSGSDSSLDESRELLLTMHDEFRRWGTEGVPILSIVTEIGPPSTRRSTFCTALPFPLSRFNAVPIEMISPGSMVI